MLKEPVVFVVMDDEVDFFFFFERVSGIVRLVLI